MRFRARCARKCPGGVVETPTWISLIGKERRHVAWGAKAVNVLCQSHCGLGQRGVLRWCGVVRSAGAAHGVAGGA